MRPAVFVLGTSHSLQCGADKPNRVARLQRKIQDVLSECGIRRIAEEMSEDGLREWAGDDASHGTICQRTAPDGAPVEFVDLGVDERASLSLSDSNVVGFVSDYVPCNREQTQIRESFSVLCGEVRERVWVARVLAGDKWPVLFVCGANHAVPVSRLFERVGVRTTIICRDFDPKDARKAGGQSAGGV